MNLIRPLALLSLAISLASCVNMQADNKPGTAASTASGVSRAGINSGSVSESASTTATDAAQRDEQNRLIAQINRNGGTNEAPSFSDTSPAPVSGLTNDVVELNYEQADLRVILEELADALDLSIIIDPSIDDRVSIRTSANRPLTQSDIWPLVRLLTRQAGVSLERSGNVYYARRQQSNLPVEITTPGTTANSTANVIMQITPLTYVSIASAIELLSPLVSPDGTVVRVSNNNTLAITATSSQLSRINELLEVVDADPFQNQGLHLYPLTYASAADLATELTEILQLIEGQNPAYQVKGLERINAILVTAPANRGFEEISRWVRLLDADSQEQAEQLFHYRVKNLTAVDLAATLTSVFELDDDEESTRRLRPGAEAEAIDAVTPDAAPVSRNANPQAVSADLRVNIVADEATNSLLIRANPRDYRQLLATISQLDAVPLQVMINAVIAQVTLTEETRFGVDWSRIANDAVTNDISTTTGTSFLPTAGLGGLLFTKSFVDGAARVESTLEAIATNNEVHLLARPSLTVINNMEGEIKIGSRVPVSSGSTSTLGDNIISSIQYVDTGIELLITPRINDDGVVNMTISQGLSSIQESSGIEGNPIFDNQEITTSIVVRDGENVVLGGLIQTSNSDLNTGVPGLNRIPVLGNLFSYQQDTEERKELFIILRPEIIDLNDTNSIQYQDILSRFELAIELFQEAGL